MHFFCTGPPFAGFLYDTYKIWHYTFGLGGLFIVLSGLLLLILPCFRQAKLLQTQFNKRRASTSATISIPCSNGNPGPVSVWIRIVISSNNMLRTRQHVVPHFMVSYIARILWYVILHTSAEIYYYTSFSRLHTHKSIRLRYLGCLRFLVCVRVTNLSIASKHFTDEDFRRCF